jgi:hypothetical protein
MAIEIIFILIIFICLIFLGVKMNKFEIFPDYHYFAHKAYFINILIIIYFELFHCFFEVYYFLFFRKNNKNNKIIYKFFFFIYLFLK